MSQIAATAPTAAPAPALPAGKAVALHFGDSVLLPLLLGDHDRHLVRIEQALGGVDHLFLANRRDYFLGLQLRFTDEDLKTILPFSGGAVGGAAK